MSKPPDCVECLRGFHGVCGDCPCCNAGNYDMDAAQSEERDEQIEVYGEGSTETAGHGNNKVGASVQSSGKVNPDYDTSDPEADWRISEGSFRGAKRDSALRDQQSTGRKRAAVLFPLDREAPCEWRGLTLAGGGVFPIQGCVDGLQSNRHHGPDKNTLNNSEGNVHRICANCHNRWHTLNDPVYTPGNPITYQIQDDLARQGKVGYTTGGQ